MEIEFKNLIKKTLLEFVKIKFDVTYVTKGCEVEIEIGEYQNEKCGPIYDDLVAWLGYDEFLDYLISHEVYHNFHGEILLLEDEIVFEIVLTGSIFDYDDLDRRCINFDEDFITNKLKLDLSFIGMNEFYNEENISVDFSKTKGSYIENLEFLYFNNNWHKIDLDINQLEVLEKYIELEIDKSMPKFEIRFDCEINWEVVCEEKELNFNYWSSPIKLKLDDIISKKH